MGLYPHSAFWVPNAFFPRHTFPILMGKESQLWILIVSYWISPKTPTTFQITWLFSGGFYRAVTPSEDDYSKSLTNSLDLAIPRLDEQCALSNSGGSQYQTATSEHRHVPWWHSEYRHLHSKSLWTFLGMASFPPGEHLWALWMNCSMNLQHCCCGNNCQKEIPWSGDESVSCLPSLNAGKDWKEAIRWDDWLFAVSSWLCQAQRTMT